MIRSIFWVFLGFICLSQGCISPKYKIQKTENQLIRLNHQITSDPKIDQYIKPYQTRIEQELDLVLAYNPFNLVKKKENPKIFNTPIGNFMAKVAYDKSSSFLMKQEGKKVDFVLLNWGGIRSDLPQGNLSKRSAFQLMPFENRLVVVQLTGQEIWDMATYLVQEKMPHPVSANFELHFNALGEIISLKIDGKPIEKDLHYWVCTTDYLARGGDRMDFFKKSIKTTDLPYNFRNAIIDYFTEIDTLRTQTDKRFIQIDENDSL